jgi:hypothetical protein
VLAEAKSIESTPIRRIALRCVSPPLLRCLRARSYTTANARVQPEKGRGTRPAERGAVCVSVWQDLTQGI